MPISDLEYCLQLARHHAYGDYLSAMMLIPAWRRRVLPLVALNVELQLIAAKVAEEMLAHIRYAWWREQIAEGRGGHPVLRALNSSPCRGEVGRGAPMVGTPNNTEQVRPHPSAFAKASADKNPPSMGEGIMPMIDEAQAAWPGVADSPAALHGAIGALLEDDPKQKIRWQRCREIVLKHGSRSRVLLAAKLLVIG